MGVKNMKDLKISKELLQCLNKHLTIDEVISNDKNRIDNNIYWSVKEIDILQSKNIYELAYKCKEWLLNQKNKDCFYIADQFSLNIESQMGVIKYFWCVLLKNNSRVQPEFKADSEIEAILKACQWVLENIK